MPELVRHDVDRPPDPLRKLGRHIEIYAPRPPGVPRLRHALFDFDGTLSLLRGGWQEVMTGQFVEVLRRAGTAESDEHLEGVCREFITRLTGKQTIYQMLQLEEEMGKRGGAADPAREYKREYLQRLNERINHRLENLRAHREPPEAHLVRGSTRLLEGLVAGGVTCYLASGTDHELVLEEADLLGLTHFFRDGRAPPRITGAQDDYRSFSKKMVIDRILSEGGLQGPELVAFGDGYVEIENARRAGGGTVGVASLETGERGWDQWKRTRLWQVGAQILTPDWEEADLLLEYLGVTA